MSSSSNAANMPAKESKIKEIAPGFFNLRAPLTFMFGLVDVGTQMSFVKLNNGRILVIDTVELTPETKAEVDALTNNGELIDGVLGTHPYHTLYFRSFHKHYPNARFYGTPRHLRLFPEIPWAGDLNDAATRAKWEPEVEMRIPDGSEFVNPLPEKTNHFNNVFVFHKASRTIHVDDTILYFNQPGMLMRFAGISHGQMAFHPSLTGPGLHPTEEAPKQFLCWMEKMIKDWDFDNIASAHNGYKIGGAKQQLVELLAKTEPKLANLSKNRAEDPSNWDANWRNTCECG
ncbi:hypothetical protein HDU96_003738 [Phlyctochytrium bullatum]|nr:hypothetical protein HDU96_003738 [Phlyctochytrium bullatum]